MKQIFNGIVILALTLLNGGYGMPTDLKTPIGYLRFENSTEAAILKSEKDNIINTNKTEPDGPPLELRMLNNSEESKVIQIKVLENNKNLESIKTVKESDTNTENELKIKEKPGKDEKKTNDKEKQKIEEDHKFKDSPKDVTEEELSKQSEVWKDFEDDFSLLEDRLPDLTDEEVIEINKDGAIPWNFLKSLNIKRNLNEEKPKQMPTLQTPIYITVPIVINTHSTLPISLSIGGQNVPLSIPTDNKASPDPAANVKVVAGGTMVTPTSNFNKIMDYADPPPRRQTNRHRSNVRTKIYARNNNHNVEEFEYKPNENFKISI